MVLPNNSGRGWRDSDSAQGPGSCENSLATPRTTISRLPRASSSPVTVIHVGVERATYAPFRDTFFLDPTVNPRLRGDGGEPDPCSFARESKRLWTTNGPRINTSVPKTATCPGSAFKNQALSADRLYSTNRNSLGYEVHRSLRGTSLCSTSKRFDLKTKTSESVGPGTYNVSVLRSRQVHHPPPVEPPKTANIILPSDRLKQWGGKPDGRPMDSADEWKITSEKPSPTTYTFQRARQKTWIEQVEDRQRRTNPEARPLTPNRSRHPPVPMPEQRLPNFIQGCRNPISTKTGATIAMLNSSSNNHSAQKDESLPSCPSSVDLHFQEQAIEAIKPLIDLTL